MKHQNRPILTKYCLLLFDPPQCAATIDLSSNQQSSILNPQNRPLIFRHMPYSNSARTLFHPRSRYLRQTLPIS